MIFQKEQKLPKALNNSNAKQNKRIQLLVAFFLVIFISLILIYFNVSEKKIKKEEFFSDNKSVNAKINNKSINIISNSESNNINSKKESTSINSENESTNANSENESTNVNSEKESTNSISNNETTNINSENESTGINLENESISIITNNELTTINSKNESTNVISNNESTDTNSENESTNVISNNELTKIISKEESTDIISDNESTKEKNYIPDYPSTAPAHLSDEYKHWSIPKETKIKLWEAIKKSPINKKTGRHFIMYSVANEGMINFILNNLCSLKLAGIPRNYHITIALDQESYDAISKIDEPVIFLKSNFTKKAVNNRKIIDFYNIIKVKPTILHQFLLWNVEPILVDADSIFIDNPLHLFNDEADFEVQCDSKVYYQIPYNIYPVPWQVNLGFFKVHPTKTLMKFMPFWLQRMYSASKVHDQSSLRKVLKPFPTDWVNNDTVAVHIESLISEEYPNLTFRFLDPMLIANAGGLYQDGKNDWIKEAKRRNIDHPEYIHFFHCGSVGEKIDFMKKNKLWFIDNKNMCLTEKPKGAVKFIVWSKK